MVTDEADVKESLIAVDSRRRHQRVRLNLLGRYMLENRREYPCQTIDVSPGSCAIIAPVAGILNERVVAYVDQLGRIEGNVVRLFDGGFAMTLTGTARRRDRLAAKLMWLANRDELGLRDDRRHERSMPSHTMSSIALPDGRVYPCRILDLSLSGALLEVDMRPPMGSPLRLGSIRAVVARHTDEGIAVEFALTQTRDSLEAGIGSQATEE